MPQQINEIYKQLETINREIIQEQSARDEAGALTPETRKHFDIANQTAEIALLSLGQLGLALSVLNEDDSINVLGE